MGPGSGVDIFAVHCCSQGIPPSFSLKNKPALNLILSIYIPTNCHFCCMWFPHIFPSLSLVFSRDLACSSLSIASIAPVCTPVGSRFMLMLLLHPTLISIHSSPTVILSSTLPHYHLPWSHPCVILVNDNNCNFFVISILQLPFTDHQFLSFYLISCNNTVTPKYWEHTGISNPLTLLLFTIPYLDIFSLLFIELEFHGLT